MARDVPDFLCDSMLGRLAKNLRMLGFDARYARDAHLKELLIAAGQQGRTLLTRRAGLLELAPGQLPPHVFIRGNDPAGQLREVLDACGFAAADLKPFSLCMRCNTRLRSIPKQDAAGRVPEYVFATIQSFTACPQCGQIYWQGTHYKAMLRWVAELAKGQPAGPGEK